MNALTDYHLMVKVKSSMDQFADGLKALGLLSRIQENPDVWRSFFVPSKQAKLTPGEYIIINFSLCDIRCIVSCNLSSWVYRVYLLVNIINSHADQLKSLLNTEFAEKGTNARRVQEQTYIYFVDFLDDCYGKLFIFCVLCTSFMCP